MRQRATALEFDGLVPTWVRRAFALLPGVKPLARLSLESKFYLATAFAFVSLLLVGALALELARGARRHADTLHQSHAVLAQLAALAAELAHLERLHFLYGAAGVDKADYLAAHRNAILSISALEQLIPSDSAWRTDLRVMAELVERQRAGVALEEPRLYKAGSHETPPLPWRQADRVFWTSPADHIRSLAAMGRTERLEFARRKTLEELRLVQIRNSTLTVGVVACLLGALLTCMVRHELALQGRVADSLARMNDELDLKVQGRTAQLAAATELLRKFSAHIEAAREAERLHVARDVHDALGSTLTALKLELSGTPLGSGAPAVRSRCRRASVELVDLALQTVEDLVTELRPAVLDRFGLWEALRWKTAHFEERTGIHCRLSMLEPLPLPPGPMSTGIFRIVEEALTNVARHARATRADVKVCRQGADLQVDICDDGVGIAREALDSADSFGLLGMSERARLLDGELFIAGTAGGGTSVRLRVPWGASGQPPAL
jgi:signal transduction histidine kinase